MGRTKILAVASGIALALGGATAAGAQGFGLGAEANWYGKALGGATLPQDDSRSRPWGGEQDFELDYDTGYTLGAAVGAYFTPNIAMELEYAYRQRRFQGGDFERPSSSNAVMLNALYKLNGMGPKARASLFRRRPRLGQRRRRDDDSATSSGTTLWRTS